MFNYQSYGEISFDKWSLCDIFDKYEIESFPLSEEQYEECLAEQIAQAEAQHEADFHNYHSC